MSLNLQTPEVERYRRIQKRKNASRNILLAIIILVIVIITMLTIIGILNHYKPSPQFMFLSERELSNQYQVKALIIRDETVYRSPADGTVRSLFADGSKVAKNETLAYVIPDDQSDELNELQEIENEIINYQYELINRENNVGASQIDQETTNQMRNTISNVYTEILNDDFSDISTDEATLNSILSQRNERLRNYNFNDSRLEELLNHYHNLEEKLGTQSNIIQSSQAGIYIRNYDGLEDRLNPSNIDHLTAEQVTEYLSEAPQGRLNPIDKVKKEDPLYCLTNSIEQYFAFVLPGVNSTEIQVSSIVDAMTNDGINLEDGIVIKSEETAEGTLIIVNCNMALERLSDRRVADLNVEANKTKGLRIPLSAMLNFKEGNVEADILVEDGGFISKTTVKIIDNNQDYALIESKEDADVVIGPSTMVVLNPKDVSVGDSATGTP